MKTLFAFLAIATVAIAAGPGDTDYIVTRRGTYVVLNSDRYGGQTLTNTQTGGMVFVQRSEPRRASTYHFVPDGKGGGYLSNRKR